MYYFMKNRGFTLIEVAVALSIFGVLITLTMGAFVKGFYLQKKVVEMQAVQREAAYLMEIMSRELRTGSGIDSSYAGGSLSDIILTSHDGSALRFCRANNVGVCSSSGEYLSMNGHVMNTSDIKVNKLVFYTSSFTNSQPLITINIELQSRKDTNVTMYLQSSVAMRLYKN